MRAVRILLVAAGTGIAGYGAWLLRPQLPATAWWLVAGPVLHDAIIAPLVALAGLTLGRLLPDRRRRWWVATGLSVTAVLVLVAVPLVWRPRAGPPNPGLQDRDYPVELGVWLAILWAGALAGAVLSGRSGQGSGDGGDPTG